MGHCKPVNEQPCRYYSSLLFFPTLPELQLDYRQATIAAVVFQCNPDCPNQSLFAIF